MKNTFIAVAALVLTLGSVGCSHKPARTEAPQASRATGTTTTVTTTTVDDGTVSGAPSSLGAPSSGRGH